MAFDAKTKVTLGVIAVAGFFGGFVFATGFGGFPVLDAAPDAADLSTLKEIGSGFSSIATEVSPSVVSVRVSKTVTGSSLGSHPFEFFGSPFGENFGGGGEQEYVEEGAGSGVIVSEDGYILTNNHVVDGATEITVYLIDETEYSADVIGTDPRTDIAVIKVDATGLPAATLGNSDNLQVGEWVLAIGNPFQLSHTVTAGIVSATGRANVGVADYEDFIQTDAAINPGNSGGALVNLNGEVVGINTAIATTTMTYSGIGFAIPSNMAKSIMDELINDGEITRGWLGVYIQPINDQLKEQFGLPDKKGALISEVVAGGPADNAGMKRGDVIVEMVGERIDDTNHLRIKTAGLEIGKKIEVKVIRNGKTKTLKVKIGELPNDLNTPSIEQDGDTNPTNIDMGFSVSELSDAHRTQLSIPGNVGGVLVSDVKQSSPAYRAGLRRGLVIVEVNNKEINNLNDFYANTNSLKDGDSILLLAYTGGHTTYISFEYKE